MTAVMSVGGHLCFGVENDMLCLDFLKFLVHMMFEALSMGGCVAIVEIDEYILEIERRQEITRGFALDLFRIVSFLILPPAYSWFSFPIRRTQGNHD